ncbi:hypothetical protein TRVA0_005S04192 [Trichomonascus vanleenenianus]|uniref:uncharacterized protein n=1 Tax=Trichomonascus vanleenenianus TaxID=2268995 RepID=UPI003ECAEBBA
MGSTPSKQVDSQAAAAAPPTFPDIIHLYYKNSMRSVHITLGEHKATPKYFVSIDTNWWGHITLYNGPSKEYPPVATAVSNKFNDNSIITLPDLLGSGEGKVQEELRCHHKFLKSQFDFSIWVKDGQGYHRETFRWRKAKRAELKGLVESHWSGWKLVRFEGDEEGDAPFALWNDDSVMKGTKGATFRFVGKGAAGEMGSLWSLMAILTWLRVWQVMMQSMEAAALAAA